MGQSGSGTGGSGLFSIQNGHHGYFGHYSGTTDCSSSGKPLNLALLLSVTKFCCARIIRSLPLLAESEDYIARTKVNTDQAKRADLWHKSLAPKTIWDHVMHVDLGPFLVLSLFVVIIVFWLSLVTCFEKTGNQANKSRQQHKVASNQALTQDGSFCHRPMEDRNPADLQGDFQQETRQKSLNSACGSVWAATLASDSSTTMISNNNRQASACGTALNVPAPFGKPLHDHSSPSRRQTFSSGCVEQKILFKSDYNHASPSYCIQVLVNR